MMLRESAADSRIVSLALGLGSRRHLLLGTTLIGLPDQVPTEQSPQRRTGSAHQCHQPGTLSDCVRRLEKELGVRLLNRTTRGLTPTEIGARLLERLRPALDEINTALNDLQEDPQNPAGSLRLHVPGVVHAGHCMRHVLGDHRNYRQWLHLHGTADQRCNQHKQRRHHGEPGHPTMQGQ